MSAADARARVPHQAVVLAAGEGRRLRPYTTHTPKPLVPFLNVPQLEHGLALLARHGVSRVLLNAWHLAERLEAWARARRPDGLTVEVHPEPRLLGTGGGLGRLASRLDPGPTLVLVADVVAAFDLADLARHHARTGAVATMAVTADADPVRYGPVSVDDQGRVRDIIGRLGRPGSRDLVNASVHLLEPAFLERFPADVPACLVRDGYLPALADDQVVAAWEHPGAWAETGTPEALLAAQRRALAGDLPVDADLLARGGRRLADGAALVHPTARVAEDARLSGGTCVGAGATIAPGCDLRQCLIAPGVSLPPNTRLSGAVVDDPAGLPRPSPQESPTS